MQDSEGRKSKDRSWQTVWCKLRGPILDFFRVSDCEGEREGQGEGGTKRGRGRGEREKEGD